MEADLRHALDETVAGTRITFTFDRIWDSPAVHFDEACVSSVAAASEALGYSSRRESLPALDMTPPISRASRQPR